MKVGVVAVTGCWDSGLVTIRDTLRAADSARMQVDPNLPELNVCTVGISNESVRSAGGLLIPIDVTADDQRLATLDLLVVPALGASTPTGVIDGLMRQDVREVRSLLRDWAHDGRRVAAACSGTFLLADTGALDKRCATTSWWLADEFSRRYPRVLLDMSRMVIEDGPITTAGAAFAHIDLAMHIVATASPQLADMTAAALLLDQRPATSVHAVYTYLASVDRLVVDFEAWIRANLHRDNISLADAAVAIGTSRRTLERRVRERLDITPHSLLQRLRVERAQHLRKTTAMSFEEIARLVGYRSASALQKLMKNTNDAP